MHSALRKLMPPEAFVLVLLLVGCRPNVELGRVSGTVHSAGKSMPNVLVTFIPQSDSESAVLRSLATTDAQGRYELKTEQQAIGAVIGKHKVIVEDLTVYQA